MNLVERVKGILLQPKSEWQVIAAEPGTPQNLYPSYIIPLAAIGPVANVIGLAVVGMNMMGGHIRLGLMGALAYALVSFLLMLVFVYVLGLIIDALAPAFQAQKSPSQAFKVAAYCMTPGWLAGVFGILPGFLAILGFLLSLYGIYLLYLGILTLMRPTQEKAVIYTLVVIVPSVVIMMAMGYVSAMFIS
ncbi:MAG: Yip1 family protein [Pseudomonadota bacterium]